jgi:kynurenine formamidase
MKLLHWILRLAAVGVLALLLSAYSSRPADSTQNLTQSDIDRWMTELSNWGRWGKSDQIGTVNLITPAKRKDAAALVKEGFSISLARDANTEKQIDNSDPWSHVMTATGVKPAGGQFDLDTYSVSYHGYGTTHMDALCHMFYKGHLYNGFPQTAITSSGAGELDITHFKMGIFTRGVLVDIPRLKGLPYLEPGMAIFPSDLQAWEEKAGIRIGSGDVVFIRTGRWARRSAKGPWDVGTHSAGLYVSCAKWLHERDIAMLGSDAASDLLPSRVPGVAQPIHQLMLIALGTPIFDNCDLEGVSEAANSRKRWTFLVTAAPISMPGGTGSPLNPVATF